MKRCWPSRGFGGHRRLVVPGLSATATAPAKSFAGSQRPSGTFVLRVARTLSCLLGSVDYSFCQGSPVAQTDAHSALSTSSQEE